MKQFLRWLRKEFDRTDLTLLVGLTILYAGLDHPALATWFNEAIIGMILVFVACVGFLRGGRGE